MNKSFLQFLIDNQFLLPAGITMLTLLTLALTLLPSDVLGTNRLWSYDKIGHFMIFGSWTYMLGLYRYVKIGKRPNMIIVFAAGVGFGLFIELLQHTLPVNRSAEPFDLLFDALGCLTAVFLLIGTLNSKK